MLVIWLITLIHTEITEDKLDGLKWNFLAEFMALQRMTPTDFSFKPACRFMFLVNVTCHHNYQMDYNNNNNNNNNNNAFYSGFLSNTSTCSFC